MQLGKKNPSFVIRKQILYLLTTISLLFVSASLFSRPIFKNCDITSNVPAEPVIRDSYRDSHKPAKTKHNSPFFCSISRGISAIFKPLTFPKLTYKRTGINATVTLVKPSETSSDFIEILQWIENIEHLAQHVCILTETAQHLAWLDAALTSSLTARLRERVRLIDMSSEFTRCTSVAMSSEICHQTDKSATFSTGYKHMCRLWFSALWPYLIEYDFILRIDIDNEYLHGAWPTNIHHFGTVKCIADDSPKVTVGLADTIWGQHVAPQKVYPYTNVMFVNVSWAVTNKDLQDIFQRVEGTNCVCINRWGDLPLWGETLSRLGLQPELMFDWKYIHKSHNATIVTDASSCKREITG